MDLSGVDFESFPVETAAEVLANPDQSKVFVDRFDSPGEPGISRDRLSAHISCAAVFHAICIYSNNGVGRIEFPRLLRFQVSFAAGAAS